MTGPVAFVLKGYPRLSETFIAQEIWALERRGLDIRIVSLRHPTDPSVHPVHREIVAPVLYLPEYLHEEPLRVARGWRKARLLSGYGAARRVWLRDLARDPTPNRIRRFGQAMVLAAECPPEVTWLHVHFLHTPASVTRYAATMRGLPWSVSAHAKDVWTTPEWEKREKIADCRWLVTCTRINSEHLSALASEPSRVDLVYHGLDLSRFPAVPRHPAAGDGEDAEHPVIILSVGRAVAKKGYRVLLSALAGLPSELHWRLIHIGGGPMLSALQNQARETGIDGRIDWRGAQPQEAVLEAYRSADLFALASRVAGDGDRDGLPNVLMEAQSQGLACLATRVSAIPELIDDGENGVLVPPDDADALGDALCRLIGDPVLRHRLGASGARRAQERFGLDAGIDRLAHRFGIEGPSSSRCA